MKAKLEEQGIEVLGNTLSDDKAEMTTEAIREWISRGADMVVCTGGMSVDPDDRTPLAIRNASDEVITYGAPVLPGAMFMLAYKKKEDGGRSRSWDCPAASCMQDAPSSIWRSRASRQESICVRKTFTCSERAGCA